MSHWLRQAQRIEAQRQLDAITAASAPYMDDDKREKLRKTLMQIAETEDIRSMAAQEVQWAANRESVRRGLKRKGH